MLVANSPPRHPHRRSASTGSTRLIRLCIVCSLFCRAATCRDSSRIRLATDNSWLYICKVALWLTERIQALPSQAYFHILENNSIMQKRKVNRQSGVMAHTSRHVRRAPLSAFPDERQSPYPWTSVARAIRCVHKSGITEPGERGDTLGSRGRAEAERIRHAGQRKVRSRADGAQAPWRSPGPPAGPADLVRAPPHW